MSEQAVTAQYCRSVSPAYVKGAPLNCQRREGHQGAHRNGPEGNHIWWENTDERARAVCDAETREHQHTGDPRPGWGW